MSLRDALLYADLGFEGMAHRAVDDAYNTARLIQWASEQKTHA